MNITFTRPYMNKKRQEHGLPKLRYVKEVWVHSLICFKIDEGLNCYMGMIECETDEYNQFNTGFNMRDDCIVSFDKTKFCYKPKGPIENTNKSLYSGFTKDLIELYHDQLKNNPNCMTEFINIE